MAPGFSVYLNTLGSMAKSMDSASDVFAEVMQVANGSGRVAQNALGFFGGAANFPAKYQAMCDNVARGAYTTSRAFTKSADEFLDLERRYAEKDDYWAKKFGVKADHIKPDIPDLYGGDSARSPGGGGQTQKPDGSGKPPAQPTLPVQI